MTDRSRSRLLRWLLASMLAVGAVGATTIVEAQQPSREEVKRFKRLMAKGAEHYKAREYERALEAFRSAEKIASPPSLKYSLGRTLQSLERCTEAKEVFENFLATEGLSDSQKAKGRKRLREVRQECTPTGTLQIGCNPPEADARVRVAGKERACPAKFELEAGRHAVSVRADGYDPVDLSAQVGAGETATKSVTLVEAGARSAGGGGNRATRDRAGWKRYVQYGGIAVGVGLFAGGLATDLSLPSRLEKIQAAEESGNPSRIRRVENQASAAKTRAAVLYATGGALALGMGSWLVYDLVTDGGSSKGATARISFTGTGLAGRIRW